jgi:hypothetical protein
MNTQIKKYIWNLGIKNVRRRDRKEEKNGWRD